MTAARVREAGAAVKAEQAATPQRLPAPVFVVPVPAAGEFLVTFRAGELTFDTALEYANAVAALGRSGDLAGISRFDAWIAAWAIQHGAAVLTMNERHFKRFPGLRAVSP